MFGNVRLASSEIFRKWSEIFGKSLKMPSSVCLYNKKNITRSLKDMNFMFSWQEQYYHSFLPFEHKIHIFSPPYNIFYYFFIYALFVLSFAYKCSSQVTLCALCCFLLLCIHIILLHNNNNNSNNNYNKNVHTVRLVKCILYKRLKG